MEDTPANRLRKDAMNEEVRLSQKQEQDKENKSSGGGAGAGAGSSKKKSGEKRSIKDMSGGSGAGAGETLSATKAAPARRRRLDGFKDTVCYMRALAG